MDSPGPYRPHKKLKEMDSLSADPSTLFAACRPCRQAKIKCERQQPCARCVRLGLQCVAQNRARGRPKVAGQERGYLRGLGSSASSVSSAPPSPRSAALDDLPVPELGSSSPNSQVFDESAAWAGEERKQWDPRTLRPNSPLLMAPKTENGVPRRFDDGLGLNVFDGDDEDDDGLDMFVAAVEDGSRQAAPKNTSKPSKAQSDGCGGGGGGSSTKPAKRSVLLAQLWANPFAREAQEKGIIVIMATALAALHRERRVDLQRLLAGLRAQALAVLRYRDPRMQSLLELTAAVVGINWRDSVDENEALEAQMSGGALGGGPALSKALREVQSIIEPWRDTASLVSYFVTVKGETRLCCDEGFTKTYMRDEAETMEINLAQTCPIFLWGRILSPEDQHCFFTSVVHAFYGLGASSGELSLVSKCVSRTGSETVCLVRFRVLFSAIGLACAFSITPLPANKYLLDSATYPQQGQQVPAPPPPSTLPPAPSSTARLPTVPQVPSSASPPANPAAPPITWPPGPPGMPGMNPPMRAPPPPMTAPTTAPGQQVQHPPMPPPQMDMAAAFFGQPTQQPPQQAQPHQQQQQHARVMYGGMQGPLPPHQQQPPPQQQEQQHIPPSAQGMAPCAATYSPVPPRPSPLYQPMPLPQQPLQQQPPPQQQQQQPQQLEQPQGSSMQQQLLQHPPRGVGGYW